MPLLAIKWRIFKPDVNGFDIVPWHDFEAIKNAITDQTAAIMLEPIQGEGGIRAHTKEFLQELRKLCDENNILLLFDEVQCGMGRTGHLFAYQIYDIAPDMISLGKGLGAGYPISACMVTEKIAKTAQIGSHGSTFGGNPMAIALGNKVLDVMLADGFLDGVKKISEYLKNKLLELAQSYPDSVEQVSGYGLMLGLKLKDNLDAAQVTKEMRKTWNHLHSIGW